jgi:Large polyvalent protein-associated domain 7
MVNASAYALAAYLREGSKPNGRDAWRLGSREPGPAMHGMAGRAIGATSNVYVPDTPRCRLLPPFPRPSGVMGRGSPVALGLRRGHAPTARPQSQREADVQELIQWFGTHASPWSRGLRDWVRQRLQRIFVSETPVDLPIGPEVTAPAAAAPRSELAQFPGLVFDARGVELDDRADQNDAAIRAGLIWAKHRWPGETFEIEGSDAFLRKARQIADEVGVAIKLPRRGRGELARRRPG